MSPACQLPRASTLVDQQPMLASFGDLLREYARQIVREEMIAARPLLSSQPGPKLLRPRQVARLLQVREGEVYVALTSGELPGTRSNTGRWAILASDVDAWIARRLGRP